MWRARFHRRLPTPTHFRAVVRRGCGHCHIAAYTLFYVDHLAGVRRLAAEGLGGSVVGKETQSDFQPMGYIAGLLVDESDHVWVQTEQAVS